MKNSDFHELHWLLNIIQSTDVGIVVLDRDFNIDIYNRFMQVHSDIGPEQSIGANIFDLFPYLDDEWFKRRVTSVFDLGIPVYTTWEQRDNVFDFALKLPIHYETSCMYQNSTFIPLRSAADQVEKVGIVIYDVTDTAMNRAKLETARDELLRLSRTDLLTQLLNRGHWEERLNEEFRRYARSKNLVSLVMLDIDHFKKINDSYGHQVGDEAIRQMSAQIKANSRDVDICGRYGGEEFAVLLPDTDIVGAKVYCERLRKSVEAMVVESQGESIQFTISLGIACLGTDMNNATDWLVQSDKALYYAKENGRNQTAVLNVEATDS
jgi:diguanylate cyclase